MAAVLLSSLALWAAIADPWGCLKRGDQFVSQELDGEKIMGLLENRLIVVSYFDQVRAFKLGRYLIS